ncbi:MAG: primosomal protein N', partial [Candidatus Omnitrophica bacterium]|nr:primosomal protein N' [Candidatus Omnitrophota bacterium]
DVSGLDKILGSPDITLIHDMEKISRWEIYQKEIQKALDENRTVLFLNTDLDEAQKTETFLRQRFDCSIIFMHRRQRFKKGIEEWLKIKNQKADIILGVRSAIFAPSQNLGLIIIDEEQSQNYKNDQVPHYNSRDVALMRATIEKTKVILASSSPSLEMMQLVKNKKINYLLLERKNYPEVQIIDMRQQRTFYKKREIIISNTLQVAINQALERKGKILLFINRKGFATFAYCRNCNFILRCPRCNVNLAYHFKENLLICHYCNYRQEPAMICPECNSSYIRYSGMGIEKIESELHRIFPRVKILKIERLKDMEENRIDIFISTQIALKTKPASFDLVGVVSVDNSLNRIDFRSAEKTYALLAGLLGLAKETLVIQTNIPTHYCFEALVKKDTNLFYDKELLLRKQLGFPPFKHFISIQVRGKDWEKVESKAKQIFEKLHSKEKNKIGASMNVNPMQPAKLRDNFYWQILIKSANPKKSIKFIRGCIKDISHSGITITIDVDP